MATKTPGIRITEAAKELGIPYGKMLRELHELGIETPKSRTRPYLVTAGVMVFVRAALKAKSKTVGAKAEKRAQEAAPKAATKK